MINLIEYWTYYIVIINANDTINKVIKIIDAVKLLSNGLKGKIKTKKPSANQGKTPLYFLE